VNALAAPASLKGVLSPFEAAASLAEGIRRVPGVAAVELPVADGGEGTAEVLCAALGGAWCEADVSDPLGRPLAARFLLLDDGTAVVEAAAAIGLPLLADDERDPLRTSSRGLGELVLCALETHPTSLLVCIGGTATVDGGAGLRAVVGPRLDVPVRAACDVRNPLLGPNGAARVFGPQKGASDVQVDELERRLAALDELAPYREVRGAGAGGGLGAAFAALGADLVEGAELVLELIGFDEQARYAALVVTGEGTVDRTTLAGKAAGAVRRRCGRLGVPCRMFGGVVRDGVEAEPLSGQPERAADDLVLLGERLARGLA
jgi:glycerate 2-kinase